MRLGRILSWLCSSRNIQDDIEAEAIQFNIERCQESATDAAMTGSGSRLRVPARAKAEAEAVEGTALGRVARESLPGITLAICRLAHPVFAFPVSCFLYPVSCFHGVCVPFVRRNRRVDHPLRARTTNGGLPFRVWFLKRLAILRFASPLASLFVFMDLTRTPIAGSFLSNF